MKPGLPLLALSALATAALALRAGRDPVAEPVQGAAPASHPRISQAEDGRGTPSSCLADEADEKRRLFVPVCELKNAYFPGTAELLRDHNSDGSWGDNPVVFDGHEIGRVGTTGLAVFAMLGIGFDHLSRTGPEGIQPGPVLRKGLQFVMDRLDAAGAVILPKDPAMEQALAALALSEAYGSTGSRHFKDAAARSVESLERLQQPDGSWGARGATRWASQALSMARLSDLAVSESSTRSLQAWFAARPASSAGLLFRLYAEGLTVLPELKAAAEPLLPVEPSLDPSGWADLYFDSEARVATAGARSSRWNDWARRCGPSVGRALRADPGALDASARTVHRSLGLMCFGLSCRYGPGRLPFPGEP